MSEVLEILDIAFKYLLEIISPSLLGDVKELDTYQPLMNSGNSPSYGDEC